MSSLLMLCLLTAQAGPFEGTWSYDDVQITLKQKGDTVTGEILSGPERGTIQSGVMAGTAMGNFQVGTTSGMFMARPQGKTLMVAFNGVSMTMTRGKRKNAGSRAAAPPPEVPGQPMEDTDNGWRGVLPPGWFVTQEGRPLWAQSRSEPGVIVVFFAPGVDKKGARTFLTQPIPLGEATITPSKKVTSLSVNGAVGLASNGSVRGRDMKARMAVVVRGSESVVIAGLAEPKAFAAVSRHVDAVARSIQFTRPPVAPNAHLMLGKVCLQRGSSMTFDGRGRVHHYYPGSAIWVAPTASTVGVNALTKGSGSDGSYTLRNNEVQIRWDDGGELTCSVEFAKDGKLYSMMCGDNDWFRGFCG